MNLQQHKIKIIISGGGTGGHVFPAIAIANALRKKLNDVDILFVGAKGKLEMEKIPAAGYVIKGLWISGFQRKLTLKNLMFPVKLIYSMIKARNIINKFKPDVIVGVGGYASGPILKIASGKKIPALIQEQNSFPGITNRLLANHVNKICVAYEGMDKFFPKDKIIVTGNPVRQDITDLQNKEGEAFEYFGLQKGIKTLLVVGGSLGARTINESIYNNLKLLADNNIQILWQTGKSYFPAAKTIAENKNVKVFEFINRMDYAYAVADFVVSRAGAIAISELCIVGKPTIFIPSPNVAEDHQTKNALALVNKNAAIMIKDSESQEKLGKAIIEFSENTELQELLRNNITALAYKNSADIIADEIIKLIKQE